MGTMRATLTFLAIGIILALGAVLNAIVSRSAYGAAALAVGLALGLLIGRRLAALERDVPGIGMAKRVMIWVLVALGFFLVPRLDPASAVAWYVGIALVYATLAGEYFRLVPETRRGAPRPVFGTPLRDPRSAHELFR
jgi:hypothetical protein